MLRVSSSSLTLLIGVGNCVKMLSLYMSQLFALADRSLHLEAGLESDTVKQLVCLLTGLVCGISPPKTLSPI